MKKKAQVLIISIWILIILTILVIGIGHRVSLALRISRFHRDRLKAAYLAKAGVNRAATQLDKDNNDFDSLNEQWAGDEEMFAKIKTNEKENEFAQVGYTIVDGDNKEFIYGMRDEERKININTAAKEELVCFFEEQGIDNAQQKVQNLLIWRGDIPDSEKIYETLGYPCKSSKFSNIEELILVKDITETDLESLRDLITVYTDGLININTAPQKVLGIFAKGIARAASIPESFADSVVTKLIEARESTGYFESKKDIVIALTGSEETNVFNLLMNRITLKSENFFIEVSGNINTIKSKTYCVYNRSNKKFLYWHE